MLLGACAQKHVITHVNQTPLFAPSQLGYAVRDGAIAVEVHGALPPALLVEQLVAGVHLPGNYPNTKLIIQQASPDSAQPAKADAESIAETIRRCPSGALHYTRIDGGPAEQPDAKNSIEPQPGGPYYVRGSIELQDAEGQTLTRETRLALCRCGQSKRKPFCDNTHRTIVWDG